MYIHKYGDDDDDDAVRMKSHMKFFHKCYLSHFNIFHVASLSKVYF